MNAVTVRGCRAAGEGLSWVEKKAREASVDGNCYSVGKSFSFSQFLFAHAQLKDWPCSATEQTYAKTFMCA